METTQAQTVLITGASSGIGFELARCFARDNFRLLMVAHFRGKLQQAAEKIQQEFSGAQVDTLAIDLSKDGAADKLFAEVQQRGWQIDVLVNDAAFGEYGLFAESDLQKEIAMIHLNVISLVHLTKLYLREMLNRNAGKILQLGSVVSFMPSPLQSVYGATKAFVLSFSEALQQEIKETNVTITVLCPPATDTNFFNVAGAQNSKILESDLATAEEVAAGGYKALMAGDARAVPTLKAKLAVAQGTVLPDAVNAAMMHKQSEESEKKSDKKKTTPAKDSAPKAKKTVAPTTSPDLTATSPEAVSPAVAPKPKRSSKKTE